jgi:hypothetical protein
MGFTKLFVPSVDSLKEELLTKGNEQFFKDWARRYTKADAVFGSEDAIDFIKQFIAGEYDIEESSSFSNEPSE